MSIGKAANDNVVPAFGPFPPTQTIAKALGSKYYFTGKPCKRGHVVARYTAGSCTQCSVEYREATREQTAARNRQRWLENVGKPKKPPSARALEQRRFYYDSHRETQVAKATAWNLANPARRSENRKRWNEENKDRNKQKQQVWYENRSDEQKERIRTNQSNMKARRKGAEGKHSNDDVQRIIAAQNSMCAECGVSILTTGYHVDHIMPIKLGGSNWPSNLQILCPTCNLEKHAMHPIDFAQKKGRLL